MIAAAALRCQGGDIQGRLKPRNPGEADRARAMGIKDVDAKLTLTDLASGDVLFAGTGVTEGDFLRGVRFRSEGPVEVTTGPNAGGKSLYSLDPDG